MTQQQQQQQQQQSLQTGAPENQLLLLSLIDVK